MVTKINEFQIMNKLFLQKLQVKNRNNAFIDPSSQCNLISNKLIESLRLKIEKHPHRFLLGCVKKSLETPMDKRCKVKLGINV